ncbi:lipoprotein signal peptidase [Thermodesulfatator indicus DSM 15286]|uniref:Lipoprotein signal peptidase n=1 Tax=Thermodesulfatator indicus (strain DSM 15286 / JCM 11887 / CIR29812) TaxID=667014 RepID=F8A983_THEID|nr:signal peptidase II [Thermodesulfatator indicus]AEH45248.1 lipoprotein signal peptidase [Thermodesulfatator indicus DSM 15286]
MERFSQKYFFITALAVAIVDQATKIFFQKLLAPGEIKIIIPGFFNLVHVWNPGVAFGFFGNSPHWARYLLMGINLVAATGLYWLARNKARSMQIFCGLVAGGAIGNFIDRFYHSRVFDFLDFHIGPYHWPAFNLADTSITLGVLGLIFIFSKEGN